ncbi:DUF362 domain-containing protein [Raoultibacter phocaeensis]|uniref:DUF362 domain-containing protein n=1 Tax=Raoultibacter phocaeensis TaxID=2479841 RepID=UPI0011191995|nr:DUF362 domain-containing protein [Raoultibacter phocaeensis]
MSDNRKQGIPRRTFLKVSVALGATAVLGGCAASDEVPVPERNGAAPVPEDDASGGAIPDPPLPYDGVFPGHEPYGEGIGACPGRVVWEHDAATVAWDGEGYWWRTENFDEEAVQRLVDDAIAVLGGQDSAAAGWQELFRAHNERSGRLGGYQPGQTIAIKANINGSGVFGDDDSGETQLSYTNPVLLRALIASMVEDASIAAGDIVVYDASRLFPRPLVEYVRQGDLADVRFVGRDTAVADESAPIRWSHKFSGSTCYLPTCVTEADYLVNLANLKGHSYGITLCGKNHFGSFLNGNEPAVTERNGALRNNPNVENYLHEAALAAAGSPSGAVYGAAVGASPANLGVHEHWNNAAEKLYGRNLGRPEGIELVAREFGASG